MAAGTAAARGTVVPSDVHPDVNKAIWFDKVARRVAVVAGSVRAVSSEVSMLTAVVTLAAEGRDSCCSPRQWLDPRAMRRV